MSIFKHAGQDISYFFQKNQAHTDEARTELAQWYIGDLLLKTEN